MKYSCCAALAVISAVVILPNVLPAAYAADTTKDCKIKDIASNEKVLVQQVTCAPGEGSPLMKRPLRVVTALKGATFKRTYDDGTTEEVSFKDGETRLLDVPKGYSFVNSGKTTFDAISSTIK